MASIGPLALGAKGCVERLHRFAQGAADWRSGSRWRIISALCPVHPFPLRGNSPQGETRNLRRKTGESYASCTTPAFPPLWWLAPPPCPVGSVSLDSQSPTAPCESSSLATRWEACHWIRGSQSSPMNPVPLPPPQFGGAAKGKRLNGQARRLTSPHLEVLCRTSTGDYKAPLCCELLMKGLLFRALFCPRLRGKSGAAG